MMMIDDDDPLEALKFEPVDALVLVHLHKCLPRCCGRSLGRCHCVFLPVPTWF
jgi:hypothetical protein